MANVNAVWGIEIGQCALKAVQLRAAEEGRLELIGFDSVDHARILSQPDADPDALISESLEKFASRNEFGRDQFVIGVPGQQTFARFCKLPPVEKKKIPEIVRFEATQQIPFEINEVVWDYEVFQDDESPDIEVGIFAMRQDLIRKLLSNYTGVGINPTMIQTVPSAVYNFAHYEFADALEDDQAVVVIDVGAMHTDLIVVEKNGAWSRNIPLGGNSFTEALVKAFKLNFAKAEQLKRTAANSKYARQVFQAMRPVFADLVAEIQRSIGFYGQTHRETELLRVLACGNAFQLPGLQKYLENNLTIEGGVKRLESFSKLDLSLVEKAEKFNEDALSFGPAYGLALQGLGLAKIRANLLPPELARVQRWKRKTPFWIAAAACFGIAAVFPWARHSMDAGALASASTGDVGQARSIIQRAQSLQSQYREVSGTTTSKLEQLTEPFELQEERALMPRILALVHEALPEVDPALRNATTKQQIRQIIEQNRGRLDRTNRGEMTVEGLEIIFTKDITKFDANAQTTSSGVLPPPEAPDRSASAAGGGGRFGGGGGRFGNNPPPPPSGGGGRFGGGAPPPTFSGGATGGDPFGDGGGQAADPGFVVVMEGRLLFGTQTSQAVEFVQSRFYPRLRELSQRPGLGFHVPDDDESLTYVRSQGFVSKFINLGAGGSMIAGTDENQPEVLYPDPVTGESMATDWKYRIWFKLRLGDAPDEPEPTAEAPQPE